MSTPEVTHHTPNLKEIIHDYRNSLKTGNIGALPATLGLIALAVIFKFSSQYFFTRGNFANLLTQAAPVMVIAMGLIFVLLLGEIDLSAGYASGVCGAVLVVLVTKHGTPWYVALLVSILVGTALGTMIGTVVARLGIPSFVVTLACFLAFQGILLLIAGEGGTIGISDPAVLAVENSNLSVTASWGFWALCVGLYTLLGLRRILARRKLGLKGELTVLWIIKVLLVAAISFAATYLLNGERGNPPDNSQKGIPIVVPVILGILIIGTFVLTRTTFGRYLYAVGGNAEAARRSGINVKKIRTSAFIICSGLSAIAGMLFVSRSNSVSPTTGGNSTLLYAVGAAVIGGTSLFGGKGKMRDAILGGLVVAVIDNGMGLLGYGAGIQFLVTGAVLLVSAGVDAVSRKSTSAS
jgi:D-xylose transport system permease protein